MPVIGPKTMAIIIIGKKSFGLDADTAKAIGIINRMATVNPFNTLF